MPDENRHARPSGTPPTSRRRVILVGGAALVALAGIAFGLDRTMELPPGYGVAIDVRTVLGPPPPPASAAADVDRTAIAKALAGIDGPAWEAAEAQIFPSSDTVRDQIACALGRRITMESTPATARLLQRAAADLKAPVDAAKSYFHRDRPFVGNTDTRTCDPRTLGPIGGITGGVLSYSYPSGHAAFGELMARVLGAAVPARAAPLSAWGRRLGDNRVACRVHWPSDIAAGRRLADAMYEKLAEKPAFRADVAAARAELAKAPPATNCRAGA